MGVYFHINKRQNKPYITNEHRGYINQQIRELQSYV